MKFNVIIVGAGPAGLSFARSLAPTGLNIAIVEKQGLDLLADPQYDGRDIALTHRSVNILKKLDVWSRLPANEISPIMEARVLDGTSSYFLHFDHNKNGSEPLGYLVSNHLLRRALFRGIETFKNISLLTESTVTALNFDLFSATVQLADNRTLSASLVVAADSRFSKTRGMAGIAADMRDSGQTAIVCRMRHERSHDNIAYECFLYGGTLAVLPLSGNQSSIVITAANGKAADILERQESTFNNEIQMQFQSRLGEMQLVGAKHSYPLFMVHADKYSQSRFALVGDAAVGMHPVTAHGFNLGLRGQDTLAKEIGLAHARGLDIGLHSILRKYETKHRRAVLPIYLGTNGLVRLYTDDRLPARIARKAALHLGNRVLPIKNSITRQLMQKH